METKYFSPSINIIRDRETNLNYIPTRNGEDAFNKIVSAYSHGTKSFNIIGAYGSGKSAFVLAFEKVINKKADYFSNILNGSVKSYEAKYIIGEFNSFKSVFCELFGLKPNQNIIEQFSEKVHKHNIQKEGLLIVVDEFGKFLEYAATENPDEELYFIQQLAEFVNSPNNNIFFITTLHQAFNDYALGLTKQQKKEWEKVKGRLVEISFNEPVEQLLFLASERIEQKNIPNLIDNSLQKILFEAINEADNFPMRDYFSFSFAQKIFPFDILSASFITTAFQSYGQNERSLFSFLESKDYLGLTDFCSGKEFYHLAHIYDYLIYNFHSLLNSRYNPHTIQWRSIDEAIQRVESVFEENILDALKLIKAIGMLSIFGRAGQKITNDFLTTYGKVALNIKNPESIIDRLEQKQIIRYRNYSRKYILFKGTDFDINTELILAEDRLSKDTSLVYRLQKHFNLPIIQAKKIFYELGTPRYFLMELSETPISKQPEGSIDGFINIVFNPILTIQNVIKQSKLSDEAILYGFYQDSELLLSQLIEIEKIEIVKEKCKEDEIALRELNEQLKNAKEQLAHMFVHSFYGEKSRIKWIYDGAEYYFNNSKELNSLLSEICRRVYSSTPILRNELMNREKLSGTISAAKNKLIDQALSHYQESLLGFEETKFPPEKAIYKTLLESTGIHKSNGDKWELSLPLENSFNSIWQTCEEFLTDCTVAKRKLSDLIEILRSKPIKLKKGFIEFWVPLFLIAKQKHIAFYEGDTFIPAFSTDTLEVAMKQSNKYYISTFALDESKLKIFNRYRFFLNQVVETNPNTDTFIETIKPFLTFYRNLLPFVQQTKNLSTEAIRLRVAIENAKDPEKVFFDEIPRALGFSENKLQSDKNLEAFTISLQNSTRELSSAFSDLINRIESYINTTIDSNQITFPENKLLLQKRFKKIQKAQLKPKLKVLIQRIDTPLDDRQSWISSVATAILNKTPDKFSDDDEMVFKNLFPKYIHDLDNITEISRKDINFEKEEVLKLEVTSFVKGVQKHLIRMPKEKSNQVLEKMKTVRTMLSIDDRQANIALLLKLLQEEIDDE